MLLLAAVFLVASLAAGFSHNHGMASDDQGNQPCNACSVLRLLNTGIVVVAVALRLVVRFAASPVSRRTFPRPQWARLTCAERAPPAV